MFAAFLAIGILITQQGFQRVETLRRIERIPRTSIRGLIPGEANLSGRAQPLDGQVLQAPDSGQACLYYHYTIERKTTDSDGKTQWRTEHRETRFVPFRLVDDAGAIRVQPHANARITPKTMHTRTVGDRRYTERRIDPGMPVFAMGVAVAHAGELTLHFDAPGIYVPILSTAGEERERGSVGLGSLLLTVAGLMFLSLAMYALTRVVGIHQTLAYLILVALTIMLTMMIQSHRMIQNDLRAAFERVDRERTIRGDLVQRRLQAAGVAWDGDWQTLTDTLAASTKVIPAPVREQVSIQRINLARSVQRAETTRRGFPERLIAIGMGVGRPATIPLTDDETQRMQALESEFVASRIATPIGGGLVGLGLLGAVLLGGLGMRRIKTKRWIENIPTVKTTGVVYGMNEIKGVVALPETSEALQGPLSNQPCVAYHYTVRERRRSGKKTTWVTITDDRQRQPFVCRDEHGAILVDPEGADVIMATRSRKRRGNRIHTEFRLPLESRVYVLGSAVIDEQTHDHLFIARGDDNRLPFIVSDYRDSELIARKAARGFLALTFGFNAFMLAGFSLSGLSGGFGALAYLAAALTPIVYLLLFMSCVLYNDLIYLRRRCDAMWANIDVALKKRFDLLPQLVAIAKRYIEHERELQQHVATLRSAGPPLAPAEAGRMVSAEHAAGRALGVLVENHPDLKGNQTVADLMRRTRDLEDDVALMREGYNHAVEIYNARIEKLPEVLLAAAFHFKPRAFFQVAPDDASTPVNP